MGLSYNNLVTLILLIILFLQILKFVKDNFLGYNKPKIGDKIWLSIFILCFIFLITLFIINL